MADETGSAPAPEIPEATPKTVPVPKTDAPAPKKKPVKKKKAKAPEFNPELFTPQAIATQIQGVHEIAAVFLGPAAKMPEASALAMGSQIHHIIELYGMDWVMKYLPWIGLVLTTAACETPVIMAVKQDLARKRRGEARPEPDPAHPARSPLALMLNTQALEEEVRELQQQSPRRGRARAPRVKPAPAPV